MSNGTASLMGLVLVILLVLILGFIYVYRKQGMNKLWAIYNKVDLIGSRFLSEKMKSVLLETTNAITAAPYIQIYEGYQLGEVSRHFDVNTSSTIQGWDVP